MRALTKITIVILILSTVIFPQNVLHVPSQYPTIQSAVNAAQSKDTILVQPNIYYENIEVNKDSLIIISAGDSSDTFIDGDSLGIVLKVFGDGNYISGFTIQNGYEDATAGAGIWNYGENFYNELRVRNNGTTSLGGGILTRGGNAHFTNIIVKNNTAFRQGNPTYYGGGGICIGGATSPHFENIIVTDNAADLGGGIYIYDNSSPLLKHVMVIDNQATSAGGGIYSMESSPYIDSVWVVFNSAGISGGGCWFNGSNSVITNSFICNNSALTHWGGVHLNLGSINLNNSTISYNYAGDKGGGIGIGSDSIYLSNLTITNNNSFIGNGDGVFGSNVHNGDILQIEFSNFMNNGYAIITESFGGIISAENNWWGHITGPYHPNQNTQGQGDSVNLYVDITPFLTAPNLDAPPLPVQNLEIQSSTINSVSFIWDQSPLSDVVGYKVHFDTTISNVFYSNTIDIGDVTEYELQNLQADSKYYITVTCYDVDGNESWFCKSIGVLNGNPLSVKIDNQVLENFYLSQNYPNPFNPTTTINYQIPELSFVTLRVYDVLGNEIATLVNKELPAGSYEIGFDATTLPSGIYFYKLQAGSPSTSSEQGFVETKKMVLLK